MLLYLVINFEIQRYYQNKPKLNRVYLTTLNKGWSHVIKVDEYKSIETTWIASHMNCDNVTHFNSFGVAQIPKVIKKFIANKNTIANTYRKDDSDSIMCRYFSIGFIDFMLKRESLLDYINLFSPKYKK